jgi:hypothetical protein
LWDPYEKNIEKIIHVFPLGPPKQKRTSFEGPKEKYCEFFYLRGWCG